MISEMLAKVFLREKTVQKDIKHEIPVKSPQLSQDDLVKDCEEHLNKLMEDFQKLGLCSIFKSTPEHGSDSNLGMIIGFMHDARPSNRKVTIKIEGCREQHDECIPNQFTINNPFFKPTQKETTK